MTPRIEIVKIYRTIDGCTFATYDEAKRYADMYDRVKEAEKSTLGERTKDVKDGRDTQNHTLEQVAEYRKRIFELAAEYIPEYRDTLLRCGEGLAHISHAERIVIDYEIKMFRDALYRLSCISEETGIEYQQPFYVKYPERWTLEFIRIRNHRRK